MAVKGTSAGQSPGLLEKWFKLKENNTTVRTEIIAGITTFMTMVYIIFVNPNILSAAEMSWNGVFIATIIATIIGTVAMALLTNYPFALAPGMGLNAFFAFTICKQMGVSWEVALGLVFIEGVLFILLSLTKFRSQIVNAIPMTLKSAISAGIGLFIAFIGFQSSGILVSNPDTIIALGDLTSKDAIVTLFGLIVAGVLYAYNVKGALLWSILAATVFGMIPGIGVTGAIDGIVALPKWADFTSVAFKLDIVGALKLNMIGVLLALLMVDIFDTAGTLIGVSTQAGYLDKDGNLPKADKALLADAIGTVGGAIVGTSTVTTFVESAAGVSEGGRTGLTGIVTSILFLLSLFFMPLVGIVPAAATAPALIVVGILMVRNVLSIDWADFTEAMPAFLTMVMMPFAYSISTGIGFGFISYAAINLIAGKKEKTNWVVNILAIVFVLYFIFLA